MYLRFGLALLFLWTVAVRLQAGEFVLVVTSTRQDTPPPSQWGPVHRFTFDGSGPLTALPDIPSVQLSDPAGVAFSPTGELFVGNRHGLSGAGSISRFLIEDCTGSFSANGIITGNGLDGVHGLAFSPWGELFAANYFPRRISRFVFDASGVAIPNGTITVPGLSTNFVGVSFSSDGELFATGQGQTVKRFRFDPDTRAAIFNGHITLSQASFPFMSAFSPAGELFVSDLYGDRVHRVLFDQQWSAQVNGSFSVLDPAGLAFAGTPELFIARHFADGGISRFLFDPDGTPQPNGTVSISSLSGAALFQCGAEPWACGDTVCNGPETPCTCPTDCGAPFCGDDQCCGAETRCTCPQDCGAPACADGLCCAPSESPCTCAPDCSTAFCGDGCCSGDENSCTCPADCTTCCGNGTCESGENRCTCPSDCGATFCGDGCCGGGENTCSCPSDCGGFCGDGTCRCGETCCDCPQDCSGSCLDGICVPTMSEWGLLVLGLLTLTVGTLVVQRRVGA